MAAVWESASVEGIMLSICFDQGISYWRLVSDPQMRPGAARFDFDADGPTQARAVATLAGKIEGIEQATQLLLAVRPSH